MNLSYRGKKRGESAEVFNRLVRAIAIMASCPYGVRFGEIRWRNGGSDDGREDIQGS